MWKPGRWGHAYLCSYGNYLNICFIWIFIHFSNMLLKASTAEQVFVACVSAGWARSLVLWLVLTKRNKGSWHNLKKKKKRKRPPDPPVLGFPGVWKLPLLRLPSRDGSPSLALLSLFLSFIFCPTSFWRQWAAFLGSWCPQLVIRSCFMKFALRSIVLSMNL